MSVISFVKLHSLWRRARARIFTALCRGDFGHLGPRSSLDLPIRLRGVDKIDIGARVVIGPNSWLEVLDEATPLDAAVIRIGDEVSITGFCTITAARQVIIEPHVMIARYAYISDHSHAFADCERPIKQQGIAKIAPVHIREGAWLGQNVVVCPGVTIGRNAVIGANSVVRDDIPDFCVAAGAPARVIRSFAPLPIS